MPPINQGLGIPFYEAQECNVRMNPSIITDNYAFD
jgi:hypothetical protein